MAGKKMAEASVVSDSAINDAVVSDSDSYEISLKSKQKPRPEPEPEPESEPESEEEVEQSNGHGNGKKKSESALYKLPMARITRIIKGENPDMRITNEATFLINKATEKFLELFAKEAYACAFLDRKNQVDYNHLSTVVAKRQRFGFLSDFVPEQVKAEDALAELSMNEK